MDLEDEFNDIIGSSVSRLLRLRLGSAVLAVAAVGLSSASLAFLFQEPDVSTTLGRLLVAGGLANLSLALTMLSLALFAIRKGKKWAFWAYCVPSLVYGLPILFLDATNVASEELVGTLAPQVAGLGVALVGLLLVAPAVFRGHD